MRSRSRDRRSSWLRVPLLVSAIAVVVWLGGLFVFASWIPDKVPAPAVKTDAVVVLTGGSGRLRAGLDLLLAGHGQRLFISGVYRGVDVKQLLTVLQQRPDEIEDRISIGNAVDTIENATETAAWMREWTYGSLRLVTAAYHMPRSLLEFRNVMPELTIEPHPVFPDHVKQAQWWAFPGTLALTVTEYNKYLLAWTRVNASMIVERYLISEAS